MKKQDLIKSKAFKYLIPLVIIWGVIVIFKGGISFGQWLYVLLY